MKLSSTDIQNLSNKLFTTEQGCKPGFPVPSSTDMAQLLKEARLALEALFVALQQADDRAAAAEDALSLEKKKDGFWK